MLRWWRRCWWRMLEVKYVDDKLGVFGDDFCHLGHQHPLSLNIGVRHLYSTDVIKILILSPTSIGLSIYGLSYTDYRYTESSNYNLDDGIFYHLKCKLFLWVHNLSDGVSNDMPESKDQNSLYSVIEQIFINILNGSLLSDWIWKDFSQVPLDKFHNRIIHLNCSCGLTIWWTTHFPKGGFWQENLFTVSIFL